MKTKTFIIMALGALALGCATSCMDGDHDTPELTDGQESYGNQNIQPTNVVTIADLRNQYKDVITGSDRDTLAMIAKTTQIEVVVTGNDIGGNFYNQISVADATGGILIDIYQGGLYGFLPIGQKLLIELKGLYIGGYGKQAQIGTPYTNPNNGTTRPSRMSRYEWMQHYKIIDNGALETVTPKEVTDVNALDWDDDNCRLVTLKGVELGGASIGYTYAPSDGTATVQGGCVNRRFAGISPSLIVLRTSTFADFANEPMLSGKVDVTGIATRYRDVWQIMMRDINDVQPATGTLQ